MKKMNFNRLGKMLLPVFFLFGLFLLSANTMNAQSHGSKIYAEKVIQHINDLPNPLTIGLPTAKSDIEMANNPKLKDKLMKALERQFGMLVVSAILDENKTAKDAIEMTYTSLNKKIDAVYLDPIKEIYLDMLD